MNNQSTKNELHSRGKCKSLLDMPSRLSIGPNMMIPEDTIELAGTVMRLHGRLSTSGPAIFVSKFVSNDFYH